MYVGQYDGCSYKEPRQAVSWNFADPGTQTKALEAEFMEQGEIDEFAVCKELHDSDSHVASPTADCKPWWRLW